MRRFGLYRLLLCCPDPLGAIFSWHPGYGDDLLIGSDGESALQARPIVVPFRDILCKVFCIVPHHDLAVGVDATPLFSHLPQGILGNSHALKDLPSTIEDNMPHQNISLALVPISFPLIPGHTVLEGPTISQSIQAALWAYHPLLSYFVEAIVYVQSASTDHGCHTTFADNLLPNGFTLSDLVLTTEHMGQSPVTLYSD